VPGFRAGKAPAAMVRRFFGEERILDEALDALVPDVYREAVEADESIDPVARPRLVVETTDPLVVKATIPVRPTIELNDYASVRVPVETVTVEAARVDETLTVLLRRAATLEPVEREMTWRDIARIDIKGAVGEEQLVDQQDVEIQLVEERDVLFPGFEEALLGHKKGETVEFDIPVPEEVQSEKFAGKQAHFVVEIKETKEEVLPELDDDFVKQVGEGFETVDALRERIRSDIQRAEEEQRDNRYHDQILGEMVDRATIEFPPVMLESEVDRLLHDRAGHIEKGEDLERYLAGIGKTEQEVREELRPIADLRLRRSLVLSKAAEAEHIAVSEDEIGTEIDVMTASAGAQGNQLREMFNSENGRDTIRRNLLTRKTLARLVEMATQDGAGRATAEEEEPGKRKRAAKKKKTPPEAVAAPATAAAVEEPAES
jgi:trigger factor